MASVASRFSRMPAWKSVITALLPLLIVGGFLLLLSQRAPTAPAPTTLAPDAASADVDTASAAVDAPKPVALPLDEQPLAVVNDTPLDAEALADALAIDRAMGRLLGVEIPAAPQAVLERLVNGRLVAQAAEGASFALDEAQIDTALTNLLAGAGQDEAALADALAAENVSDADFHSAFAQLLLVDQFTRQQAAAQGVDASDYLRSLQTEARISFGPGVAALSPIAVEASTEPPAPAEEAAADTPPAALADSQPALPTASGQAWELLPFVPDPAFASSDAEAPPSESGPVLTGSSSAGSVEQIVTGTATGNFVPDFSAALATGDGTLTLADLKGKPTLLSFWTTWCPYCLRQTPLLVEAYSRWAGAGVNGAGVNFVGVNVGEASAQVLPYLETHAIDYPVGLDESSEIAAAYAVRGFPTTYFLDAEARVVARHVGQLSAEDIESYLNQITQNP